MAYSKIIMGIDPGTNVMGYGLIGVTGKKAEMIVMGVIKLSKFENHYKRLRRIYDRVLALAEQYRPDELAIEAPFFGKNVQSMLKLGRAQGVAMAAALAREIPITEYPPLSVKQAVTGNGKASKEQVANMLQRLLNIPDENMPHLLDATDALGVAMAHFYEQQKPPMLKSSGSWSDFLKKHPERLVQCKTGEGESPQRGNDADNAD